MKYRKICALILILCITCHAMHTTCRAQSDQEEEEAEEEQLQAITAQLYDGDVRDVSVPETEQLEQLEEAEELDLLFQLVADKATYQTNGGAKDGILVLTGVANTTVAFTERPVRLASEVPTDLFISTAFTPTDDLGEDSFYTTAPNAALSCVSSTSGVSRVVVELYSPSLVGDELTFDVKTILPSEADLECDIFAVRALRAKYKNHSVYTHPHTPFLSACISVVYSFARMQYAAKQLRKLFWHQSRTSSDAMAICSSASEEIRQTL